MSQTTLAATLVRLFDEHGIHSDCLALDTSRTPYELQLPHALISRTTLAKRLKDAGEIQALSVLRATFPRIVYVSGRIAISGQPKDQNGDLIAWPEGYIDIMPTLRTIRDAAKTMVVEAMEKADRLLMRLADHVKMNHCQVAYRRAASGHAIEVAYVPTAHDPLDALSITAALATLEQLAETETVHCDLRVRLIDPAGNVLAAAHANAITIELNDKASFMFANGHRQSTVRQAIRNARPSRAH